jgi:hydroxymethylbilane synthase
MAIVKLGTRGSQLALYQANTTAALLKTQAGIDCEIVVIKTSGDRLSEAPLSQIGGKRLFVKEIEDALLAGDIDIAVHSSKDLPAVLPPGLVVGAVLPREDPRDAVVLPGGREASSIDAVRALLGPAPTIGTSSVRRIAQLIPLFPGARFDPIRGNLDTRLRKLDSGDYDALILAAAGLRRLQHAHRISTALPADRCVPAPGQGIIAIEIRDDDRRARELVTTITDATTSVALEAERALVTRLGGGCQLPIGAYATVAGETMTLAGIVIALDGSREVRTSESGSIRAPEALGIYVADSLLARGADTILAEAQRVSTDTSEQP